MTHGGKGPPMVRCGERGLRQPVATGHGDKGCARHGPWRYVATVMGDGGSRAYIRGDGGRRPPPPQPPTYSLLSFL
jgi:hypothetical protein